MGSMMTPAMKELPGKQEDASRVIQAEEKGVEHQIREQLSYLCM